MRKLVSVFIFIFLLNHVVSAQSELARIIDRKTGDVHEAKNSSSRLITTLESGELFLCEPSKESWWLVQRFHDRQGFLPKSSISLIKDLPEEERRHLLQVKLLKMLDYYNLPKEESEKRKEEIDFFEQNEYTFMLSFMPDLFCKKADVELLHCFIEVLAAIDNFESEVPAMVLAECYICQHQLVTDQIDLLEENDQKLLKKQLSIGFDKLTWAREDEVKGYKELKANLEKWLK